MRLKRVFIIDGKEVADPSPSTGDIGVIKKLLSTEYPDVLNRSYSLKLDTDNGIEKYEFSKVSVGTHG